MDAFRCLDAEHVCDGVPQCADKEDEGKLLISHIKIEHTALLGVG